jgi:mercuric ion transport protein
MDRSVDARSAEGPESNDAGAVPRGSSALALAGIAALLASTCCVVPLLFAIVGISGAWISRLRVLEPYSSALIGLAVVSLVVAAWGLFRPARADESCATVGASDVEACRRSNARARGWFWLVAVLTVIPIIVPLVAPLFY